MFEAFEERPLGRRPVIIKRLRDPEDEAGVRAFFQECRILESLDHPNIVPLLDVGTEDKRPFQVFEAIDGLDAAVLITRARELGRSIPSAVAYFITAQVAQGLAYAHARPKLEIVHRDVSPDNILLSFEGRVLLADFGIALFSRRARHTALGFVKGKQAFMSPEQVLGGPLDHRSDIYSLGCVLHALLTGASPFADESNLDRRLMQEDLQLDLSLEASARALLARALAPERRARYQDAAAFAAECVAQIDAERGPAELSALLEELGADQSFTRVSESFPAEWSIELDGTTNEERNFTASSSSHSGGTLSDFLTSRDPTDTGETKADEVTAPRVSTKTWPRRRRDSVGKPRPVRRTVPSSTWALGLASVAFVAVASVLATLERTRPAATPRSAPAPVPTPQVVPVPEPIEAPPVDVPDDPKPEPKSLPSRRRPTPPSPEVAMNRALERLVRKLDAQKDALPPAALANFERRYLELGTAANRASTDEERLRVARLAEALAIEITRAASRR